MVEEAGGDKEKEKEGKRWKGKTCKGCLYYSSQLKSESRDPICFGLSTTLEQVPGHVVRDMEIKASKEKHNLTDWKYYCIGYSVYLDAKDFSADPLKKQVNMPFCAGIKLLAGKKISTAEDGQAHVNSEEDGQVLPRPRRYQLPQSVEEGFLSRFNRNANLVASGVSRNMHRVGRYIKENVDDILYPYRRPPK